MVKLVLLSAALLGADALAPSATNLQTWLSSKDANDVLHKSRGAGFGTNVEVVESGEGLRLVTLQAIKEGDKIFDLTMATPLTAATPFGDRDMGRPLQDFARAAGPGSEAVFWWFLDDAIAYSIECVLAV